MNTGARIRNVINHLEEGFMATALAIMTLLTFIQVVLREFGTGWVWSLEATTYVFAWLVLVGMSYGVRTQSHIAVDIIARKMSPTRRRPSYFVFSIADSCFTARVSSSIG